MPPRPPVTNRSFSALHCDPYVCPSCLRKEIPARTALRRTITTSPSSAKSFVAHPHRSVKNPKTEKNDAPRSITASHVQLRRNGFLASNSAINAPTRIPPSLRDLHHALTALQKDAESNIDQSRVHLALQSLESSDPPIRVAFVGLGRDGMSAALNLARVLLSDVLGDEASWEKTLEQFIDGCPVLLRYGEATFDAGVLGSAASPVQTIFIPSPFLQTRNLEILVTPYSTAGLAAVDAQDVRKMQEAFLVPSVTMPNSSGGRVGFVRYPVHSALLVAQGVSGLVEYGRLAETLVDRKLINAALSVPFSPSMDADTATHVDIQLAAESIRLLRADNANGAKFSNGWIRSRVSSVADWLTQISETSDSSTLKPAVDSMIKSLLAHTWHTVAAATTSIENNITQDSLPEPKRAALQQALSHWSEQSHTDLRDNLDFALDSTMWRRTTWWRLFWRIDEVSLAASDVLQRGWLVDAEQHLAFLAGRLVESSLISPTTFQQSQSFLDDNPQLTPALARLQDPSPNPNSTPPPIPRPSQERPSGRLLTLSQILQLPASARTLQRESGLNLLSSPPWPPHIYHARQRFLHAVIPALHRRAQTILLSSLSTIGSSSALAIWIVAATGGTALYEAGAVSALGLVWSLRRLQRSWTREREGFVEAAREDGRLVLEHVRKQIAEIIVKGSESDRKVKEKWGPELRVLTHARQAVLKATEELEKVEGGGIGKESAKAASAA